MQTGYLIRILGPVDVVTPTGRVRIGSRNERAVLAALVLAGTRAVPMSVLRDLVWPHDPPRSAEASIHTYVSRLRNLLGHARIERADHSYRLEVSRSEIDATRFEDLVDAAAAARSDPPRCAQLCREALQLWRGEPFGDLGDDEAFRLEGFRLEELRLVAMELALDAEIELGHHELAAAELETAVQEHPYRERLWYLLADSLRRDGRRVEALRACEGLRRVLADAGLEPASELIALERRIAASSADGDVDTAGRPRPT
jgi:DNA-binding SARP family transcriptional activator